MTDAPPTEEELARGAKDWQATVYRNRGPVFVAEAQFGLRLIAEVRRLRALVRAYSAVPRDDRTAREAGREEQPQMRVVLI